MNHVRTMSRRPPISFSSATSMFLLMNLIGFTDYVRSSDDDFHNSKLFLEEYNSKDDGDGVEALLLQDLRRKRRRQRMVDTVTPDDSQNINVDVTPLVDDFLLLDMPANDDESETETDYMNDDGGYNSTIILAEPQVGPDGIIVHPVHIFENPIMNGGLTQHIVASDGFTQIIVDNPQANLLNEPFVVFDTKLIEDRVTSHVPDSSMFRTIVTPSNENRIGQRYSLKHGVSYFNSTIGVYPDSSDDEAQIPIIALAEYDDYESIRINFNTDQLNANLLCQNFQFECNTIRDEIIPQVKDIWLDKLSVVPVDGNLMLTESSCGEYIIIPDEHIEVGVPDTDLIVYVTGIECNEDNKIYGFGSPCAFDQENRPIAASLVICLDDLRDEIEDDNPVAGGINLDYPYTTYVAAHEMGHIFGMLVELFEFFIEPRKGTPWGAKNVSVTCRNGTNTIVRLPNNVKVDVNEDGIPYYKVVTYTLGQVARNYFDCNTMDGVRLTYSDDLCFTDSNWHPRVVRDDVMSPTLPEVDILTHVTPFTLGLLDDTGWYLANFENADISVFGYGAGCDFVDKACIVNGSIPSYAKNTFCNEPIPFIFREGFINPDPDVSKNTCDVGYKSKSMCDLMDYTDEFAPAFYTNATFPPEEFQYFPDENLAAFYNTEADFCPMAQKTNQVYCEDKFQEADFPYDTYSEGSRCFNTDQTRSVCLNAFCNSTTRQIQGSLRDIDANFTCEYDGQQIFVDAVQLQFNFTCPPFKHFCPELNCPGSCSGRGICNATTQLCVCDPGDLTPGCYLSARLFAATDAPSLLPSTTPSSSPSSLPSINPTSSPTSLPSTIPSSLPSISPSSLPSSSPSSTPSSMPSLLPTTTPTLTPSLTPSSSPSLTPSSTPSLSPSKMPTLLPSVYPTDLPSCAPSIYPTMSLTYASKTSKSKKKTSHKTSKSNKSKKFKSSKSHYSKHSQDDDTDDFDIFALSEGFDFWPNKCLPPEPSAIPSLSHKPSTSSLPSVSPTVSLEPSVSANPTSTPSSAPSEEPSLSSAPSYVPSISKQPTTYPTLIPSRAPSLSPTLTPTSSFIPTKIPSVYPTISPSGMPSPYPTNHPTLSSVPSISKVSSTDPTFQPIRTSSFFSTTTLGSGSSSSVKPSESPVSSSFPP